MQPCVTVAKCPCTSTCLMSPYYTKRQPNHNLVYTWDHTFGYRSKKFICVCAKLSAHAYCTKFRGSNFKILKLPWDMQGLERWATDLQVCKWMSGGDPRTATFHQTRLNAGDTACSVKGVLPMYMFHRILILLKLFKCKGTVYHTSSLNKTTP